MKKPDSNIGLFYLYICDMQKKIKFYNYPDGELYHVDLPQNGGFFIICNEIEEEPLFVSVLGKPIFNRKKIKKRKIGFGN